MGHDLTATRPLTRFPRVSGGPSNQYHALGVSHSRHTLACNLLSTSPFLPACGPTPHRSPLRSTITYIRSRTSDHVHQKCICQFLSSEVGARNTLISRGYIGSDYPEPRSQSAQGSMEGPQHRAIARALDDRQTIPSQLEHLAQLVREDGVLTHRTNLLWPKLL